MRNKIRTTLLAATAALCLVASPALAEMKAIWNGPIWGVYAGQLEDGSEACSMSAGTKDGGSSVHVKFFENGDLAVQVFKHSWKIPEDTKIAAEIGFDKGTWGTTDEAYGGTSRSTKHGYVVIQIGSHSYSDFLDNFKHAKVMWVRFGGNEAQWNIPMDGSHNAATAFEYCVGKMAMKPAPTQPYSGNAGATQPFDSKQKAESF
jgi:hypothetical protein